MDPLTAFLLLMVEMHKGATAAQKERITDWILQDIGWWRRRLGIDKDEKS